MKLYNTLTRMKEEFVPIEEGRVRMYSCGPTVYDYIHIGNARPAIVFDVLRRYLEYRGYDVTFVQNFTDVDDKIINRANEQGITAKELADKYIEEYFRDADALGIRRASVHPRVSEHMDEIIDMISHLIENGKAYEKNGSVYYSVESFPDYGELSRQSIEDLRSGARVEVDEEKNSPLDFAVWKAMKPGEPYWESPWGKGRPGWHIECSAMSTSILGKTIDIHGGGQDLIFPHHENEIAQSEGACGCRFANYWVHNGYINIDKVKMSKSLGNFFTVRDIAKEYDLAAVRMFMLMAQYRSPVNFSREMIEQSAAALERLTNFRDTAEYRIANAEDRALTDDERAWIDSLDKYRFAYDEAMDDDLNTADAIAAIFDLVRDANAQLDDNSPKPMIEAALALFTELAGVLGIAQKKEEAPGGEDERIEALIEERQTARKNRDFKRADEIRDQLAAEGIELMDTREGVRWKRV